MPERDQLQILSIGYPLVPVGTGLGGGAEHILHLIDRGLVSSGHRSIVIAAQGSKIAGELRSTPTFAGQATEQERMEAVRIHQNEIEFLISKYNFDLIHYHGLDFYSYLPKRNQIPQLATLHLPLSWYPEPALSQIDLCLNCVSHSQAGSSPAGASYPVILNGIDLASYHVSNLKEDYLLWLGRICPEKGVDIALRVAQRLQLPMIVAGPVHPFPEHQSYFQEKVQPLLDQQRRYIGPVELEAKAKLLAEARCLLVPSLVAETSSLVAMEAISSGTPVVALRSGALPEIVDHELTGFIVDSEDELAKAVLKCRDISPQLCRSVAEKRFAASRMLSDYLELYRRLIIASCAPA